MSCAGGVRVDIAGRGKARAQTAHARMAVAEPQRARPRDLRPAAAGDDSRVALDGLLGGLRRRRRNGRHRRFRHMDGAGGLVETLPELPALGIADQRIERGILGEGRARRRSGARPALSRRPSAAGRRAGRSGAVSCISRSLTHGSYQTLRKAELAKPSTQRRHESAHETFDRQSRARACWRSQAKKRPRH